MFGKADFNTAEGFDRWFEGVQCGYGGGFADNEGFNYHYSNQSEYATDLIARKTIEWPVNHIDLLKGPYAFRVAL